MPATDVPASVRRAFAAKRLQSAWAMLRAEHPPERSAAIEGVIRILESEGLCLDDVMTTILAMPIGPYRRRAGNDGQGDLFAARTDGARTPHATVRIVSGRDVPQRIGGRIVVLDDRIGRKGPEMIVAVVGFEARYDPIAARNDRAIAALRAAAEKGGLTQLEIEPARTTRQMPCVARVGMGIVI